MLLLFNSVALSMEVIAFEVNFFSAVNELYKTWKILYLSLKVMGLHTNMGIIRSMH